MDSNTISLIAIGLVIGANYLGFTLLVLVLCTNMHFTRRTSENRQKLAIWHTINWTVTWVCFTTQNYYHLDNSTDWGIILYAAEAIVGTICVAGITSQVLDVCGCHCCSGRGRGRGRCCCRRHRSYSTTTANPQNGTERTEDDNEHLQVRILPDNGATDGSGYYDGTPEVPITALSVTPPLPQGMAPNFVAEQTHYGYHDYNYNDDGNEQKNETNNNGCDYYYFNKEEPDERKT